MTIADQIQAVEDEISHTKYNKATSHHIGKLKAKLAHLRLEMEKHERVAGGGGGGGFGVKKSGHASVGLVGLPSVGKSTILNALTGAESAVAAYHFTTLSVIPGVLEFKGAKIQVLDMPGVISGASRGKGRGREVLSVARSVDLILLVLEATNPDSATIPLRELSEANVRLNKTPPDVTIRTTDRGGVLVRSTVPLTQIDEEYVRSIAQAFKRVSCEVVIRQDVSAEEVVDAFAGNRVYNRGLIVINKIDLASTPVLRRMVDPLQRAGWRVVPVSAEKRVGIERLRNALYEELRFIRVYLKPQGGEADLNEPLVIKSGSDIAVVCDALHRDFRKRFRWANVWGKSAKFPGQTVGIDHVLKDEDILTLVLRRG